MAQLVWTARALRDVSRLRAFLADVNPDAAGRAIQAIRRSVRLLSHHPRLGRPVGDMPFEYREWLIRFGSSGYVVRYRYSDDIVSVLAVRHGREVGFDDS